MKKTDKYITIQINIELNKALEFMKTSTGKNKSTIIDESLRANSELMKYLKMVKSKE